MRAPANICQIPAMSTVKFPQCLLAVWKIAVATANKNRASIAERDNDDDLTDRVLFRQTYRCAKPRYPVNNKQSSNHERETIVEPFWL